MTTPLAGNRYIAYARCASPRDAAAKLDRQIRAIRRFADGRAMRCVSEARLAGVSGGPPAMRSDLLALLARKQEQDDFNVLVMEDFARLTRAGLAEGLQVQAEFDRCGVQIMYVADACGVEDKLRGVQ
jgi:hypothetical protein